jgi:hypothetical protein
MLDQADGAACSPQQRIPHCAGRAFTGARSPV